MRVHTKEDIVAISICYAQMERTQCYFFGAYRENNLWFFDAQCFLSDEQTEVRWEKEPLSPEEVEELFSILEETDVLSRLQTANQTKKLPLSVKDEETRVFCLTFSDSTQVSFDEEQPQLVQFFYRLAEAPSAL